MVNAQGQTITNPPVIQSLMSAMPSLADTQKAVQGFYAPALATIAKMQDAAQHAADLRQTDINAYTKFVTDQATQAQDKMQQAQTGYTQAAGQQAANLGGYVSDAQNIVNQNQGLAAQSGLAGGVKAAGDTLGAAQLGAQGVASTAQANQAAAAGQTQYALDMAATQREAAQTAQTNLEVNTFLPKMLEIQQAIPGAISQLYTTEEQRAIEAGKIAQAGNIAGLRSSTALGVAGIRANASTTNTNTKAQASIYNQAAKDATASQDTWIRANASINVANIKGGSNAAKNFLASIKNGPVGSTTSWNTFNQYSQQDQATMVKNAIVRAKLSGVTSFQQAVSAVHANDMYANSDTASLWTNPQYQQMWNQAWNSN